MDFRFDKFVEHWCEIYKPMLHVPGRESHNRRFFLTDSYMGMADFMRDSTFGGSPAVVMESNQEGRMSSGLDHPVYALYFLVKSLRMSDGEAAIEAKLEAKGHLMKFLAYLRARQEAGEAGIQNINLDDPLEYQSIGPLYDGWYGVFVSLEDICQYNLCSVEDDYISGTPPEEAE